MFDYFNKITINGNTVLDIWKNIDINIDSDDYQVYKLKEGDNLMLISYNFYGNINDWWIIYLFNDMYNINFELLQPAVLEATLLKHRTDILEYNTITIKRQNYIRETLRTYYMSLENSLVDSIKLANKTLKDDSIKNSELFLSEYASFLEDKILIESYYNTPLKIPNGKLMFKIKNALEDFSSIWN